MRVWSVEPDRPALESQCCRFLAVSPWVSYFTCLALFPHLQNGVKVHTAKALFFSSKIAGAIAFIAPSTVLAAARMRQFAGVLGLESGLRGKPASICSTPTQSAFDPVDAEDASGYYLLVPDSGVVEGVPGFPACRGAAAGLGHSQLGSGTLGCAPASRLGRSNPRRPCPRSAGGGDWLASAPPPPHQPRRRRGGEPSRQLAAAASAVPPSVRSGGDNGRPAGRCTRGGRPR